MISNHQTAEDQKYWTFRWYEHTDSTLLSIYAEKVFVLKESSTLQLPSSIIYRYIIYLSCYFSVRYCKCGIHSERRHKYQRLFLVYRANQYLVVLSHEDSGYHPYFHPEISVRPKIEKGSSLLPQNSVIHILEHDHILH